MNINMALEKIKPTLENLKNKSSWGGRRKKAGRHLGKQNQATLEKNKVLEAFKQRVLHQTDKLFNAQISLATGCSMLYRIETVKVKGKETGKKHILVTDEEEIKDYLDGTVDTDDYYYITTKLPDNKAIDSLMDRAFGKVRQNIGLGGEDEGSAVKIEVTQANYERIIAREAKRIGESSEE